MSRMKWARGQIARRIFPRWTTFGIDLNFCGGDTLDERLHVLKPSAVAIDAVAAVPVGTVAVPLVVDVDGSLLRTDLLHEAVFQFLRLHPLRVAELGGWLAQGKSVLKDELAREVELAPEHLPYNEAVLAAVRAARDIGRPVYLASASPRARVAAIAAHLQLFDGIFASDRTDNLKGERKAQVLVEAFGEGGFDYVGDGPADLPVWRRARHALAVPSGAPALRRLRPAPAEIVVLDDPAPRWWDYFLLLRPQQWSKNVLLFLSLLASHSFTLPAFAAAVLGFVAFSLAASGAYVVNDLTDIQDDRRHPSKRLRPFAAGLIPPWHGVVLAPVLLLAALALGALLPVGFFLALLGYIATTFLYSFFLKRKPLVDVMTLAGLYTLRAVAGALAIAASISPWLLAFCLALFMCLAIVKRLTELARFRALVGAVPIRGYLPEDSVVLAALGAAAGFGSVLVLALYINSEEVRLLYAAPDVLWGVCVLVLYWISRILLLSHRGQMADDPIVWALRDRVSSATAVTALVLVIVAAYA
jgi:4-hydroxybenzoate polyprenyltransferase